MTIKISLAEKSNNAAKRSTFVGNIYEQGVEVNKRSIIHNIHPELMKYHVDGYIHIHDLEGYGNTYNCLTCDILANFPYESLRKSSDTKKILQLIEYYKVCIANIANEQSGGIAFANFDSEISTAFKKLDIADNEENLNLLYEGLDCLLYWLNYSLTRYGQECYYVSFNIGLDTSKVGRFVIQSLLSLYKTSQYNVSLIRPNIIFKVHNEVNLGVGSPNYDLLQLSLETTAIKMNPTYLLCSSASNQGVDPAKLAIVGCRTKVISNLFGEKTSIGRGNIANISINLPRLALEAKYKDDKGLEELKRQWSEIVEIVKILLLDRFERTCMINEENYPANRTYQLWNVPFVSKNSLLRDVFKQGTLSIGFIGLSEAFEVLYGDKIYNNSKLQQKSLEFVAYMRDYTDKCTKEEQLNFSLLATSGEGISSRFVDIDRKFFSSKVLDKGYYTNSFHVDVDSFVHPFSKLEIEGPYHSLCNGGAISYVELGSSPQHNSEALFDILYYAHKVGVGYLGYNYPLDICLDCKHAGTFDVCPNCKSSHIKRIRRVSGYLEDLSNFGKGKRLEEQRRQINPLTRKE